MFSLSKYMFLIKKYEKTVIGTRLPNVLLRELPCILVMGEAAPAADLITRLIFKHLEQNLGGYTR